jgi:SnoaL-like domain
VERSPLVELLEAIDRLDVEAAISLCAPDCVFMTVDGRHAEGRPAVARLLSDFLGILRSTSHEITAQWHQDDVWIAEALANYELRDWLRVEHLPRAMFVRTGADGIRDVRVYGANERQLDDRISEPTRVGGRRILPL